MLWPRPKFGEPGHPSLCNKEAGPWGPEPGQVPHTPAQKARRVPGAVCAVSSIPGPSERCGAHSMDDKTSNSHSAPVEMASCSGDMVTPLQRERPGTAGKGWARSTSRRQVSRTARDPGLPPR